jgi:hypothetical protein
VREEVGSSEVGSSGKEGKFVREGRASASRRRDRCCQERQSVVLSGCMPSRRVPSRQVRGLTIKLGVIEADSG